MRRAGHQSSSKLISFKKVKAELEINTRLDIAPNKQLIRIERVRLADNVPVAYDITWMPASYGQLLLDEDLSSKTIYQILEDEYDIPIIAGRYNFTASIADANLARYLRVKIGDPLLEIDRCSKTTGKKKIYYQRRFHNPKYISYEIELDRHEDEKGTYKQGLPLKEFSPKFKF
jgi:GntR family transcriptional regulator